MTKGKAMSFGSDPNPFQQMGRARPKQPSIVPKIIAVVAALFVLAVLLIIVAVTVKSVGGGLAQGLYGSREKAREVSDVELWNHYNDDEDEAKKMFGDRWVVVKGVCSDVIASRPDGSAINEEYSIQVGRRDRKFDEEWLINCNIPRKNVEEFNKRVKTYGIVSVRGKVKGHNSYTNQIDLKECEFVSFSIK